MKEVIRVYVAARFAKKDFVAETVTTLEKHGFVVVSTWHLEQVKSSVNLEDLSLDYHIETATRDLQEIKSADVILSFSESPNEPHVRGGRHVEFGYGLALKKFMVVVGPRENIFHCLPEIHVVSGLGQAMMVMTAKVK